MNDNPRVSVIIPTYNRSAVLRHAIASVLAQSFADFELLVVGDCCTDDSAAVVAGFGDPRIRWFNLPANSGHQSGPNNEGLRQARGELIAYLGHDDLWLPHHLQTLAAAIDEGADIAAGITEFVGPGELRLDIAPSAGIYRPGIWLPPTGFMHRRRGQRENRRLARLSRADDLSGSRPYRARGRRRCQAGNRGTADGSQIPGWLAKKCLPHCRRQRTSCLVGPHGRRSRIRAP